MFKIESQDLGDTKVTASRKTLTEEFLIDLINRNPTLNMAELAKLTGTSPSTIYNRIKKINNSGVRVNYAKKNHKPVAFGFSNPELTYEFLDDLINNNPDLNMEELAELAGVLVSTMSRKIMEFNKAGKTINYCKKGAKKFTDEFLIDLFNNNSGLSKTQLVKFTCISETTLLRRTKKLEADGRLNYKINDSIKLTDELLIETSSKNPELGIKELTRLPEVSEKIIPSRIKRMGSNEERVKYSKKNTTKLTD